MKSIGDFAVKIFADFDTKSLKSGAGKVASAGKSIAKAWGVGAAAAGGYFAMASRVAEADANLARQADMLGMSVEKLSQYRNAFELAGAAAENADSIFENLTEQKIGAWFGEADFETLALAGIRPEAFKDPVSAIEALRKAFKNMTKEQRLYFAKKLPVGTDALKLLAAEEKEYQRIMRLAKETAVQADHTKKARAMDESVTSLGQTWQQTKREIVYGAEKPMSDLINTIKSVLTDEEFLASLREFIKLITKMLEILVSKLPDVINALKPFVKALTVMFGGGGIGDAISAMQTEKTKSALKKDIRKERKVIAATAMGAAESASAAAKSRGAAFAGAGRHFMIPPSAAANTNNVTKIANVNINVDGGDPQNVANAVKKELVTVFEGEVEVNQNKAVVN